MAVRATISSTVGTRVSVTNQTNHSVGGAAVIPTAIGTRVSVNNPINYGLTAISQLSDVDMSDADTGETLVYDESLGKFIVKQIPGLDGGTF